jgi:hypothetical protein
LPWPLMSRSELRCQLPSQLQWPWRCELRSRSTSPDQLALRLWSASQL